jgi:hypothetical protein
LMVRDTATNVEVIEILDFCRKFPEKMANLLACTRQKT